jgi:hypothetical protein
MRWEFCMQCMRNCILFFQDSNGSKINIICRHSVSLWLYLFCSSYISEWKEKVKRVVYHQVPLWCATCVYFICTSRNEMTPCFNAKKSFSYDMCTELCWSGCYIIDLLFVVGDDLNVNWNLVTVPESGRCVVLGEDSQLPTQGSIPQDMQSIVYSLAAFIIPVQRSQHLITWLA